MTRAQCLLIGDIGGTNARFALVDPMLPGFHSEMTLACRDFESAEVAIRHYLARVKAPDPAVICLAVAGPIVNERASLTNNDWRIVAQDLRKEFAGPVVALCNDFEAIAYSVPTLQESDLLSLGRHEPRPLPAGDFSVGVIGPGTGLGAAGLFRRGDRMFPVVGEAGHEGFAPETQMQIDIFVALRERFDRVSDERLVSGPGLENIYWALSRLRGDKSADLAAAEIGQAAAESQSGHAVEALQLFFEILGQVAGNLALTLGAIDGIYIAGGIARRYPDLLIGSRFRSGFEAKGRHRSLMERIPTQLIVHPEPGLLGAATRAKQLLLARI
jgi:glucokinase